jgi:hypothetical protein
MGWLVAESLTKDSLFAAIQQRLSGMSNIINLYRTLYIKSQILAFHLPNEQQRGEYRTVL